MTLEQLEALYATRKEKLDKMKELNAKDTLDDAEKETFKQLEDAYAKADREIQIGKQQLKLANEVDDVLVAQNPLTDEAKAELEYTQNFNKYMDGSLTIDGAKAVMTISSDVKGGYTVPVTYRNTVLEKLNAMGRTRGISSNIRTTSTEMIPIEGDTPVFDWIGENGQYPKTDAEFGQTSLSAHKLGGIIQVSEELLQDSSINMEEYLARKIALGMDNKEKVAFTVGTGTGQPTGYTTGLVAGANSTTAAINAVTADELFSIWHDLKEEYRMNAVWRMNDLTLKSISSLKGGDGVYLFPTLRDGSVPMLFGKPIVIDDSLPNMATGAKFLAVGDFSYYQIGDRGDMTIQRLNELYAENGLIGYKVTARVDGKRLLDEAFNVAQNA